MPSLVVGLINFLPTNLGRTDLVEHEIMLTDDIPFQKPYRGILQAPYEEVGQYWK